MLEPNWILWPWTQDRFARLLSLTTGVDWSPRPNAFAVRGSGSGQTLVDTERLGNEGLFAARTALFPGRRLVPLGRPGGALSIDVIALCSDGLHPVVPASAADLRDPQVVIIAIARDGEDVVRARESVSGRVLIVETPSVGRSWSRFYLLGKGWPAESSPRIRGVPGLLPAREVGHLLGDPASFEWVPSRPLLYREADRWLAPAQSGWATWTLVIVSLVAAGLALLDLATDLRRLTTSIGVLAALAFPASVLLSPIVAAEFGPELGALATLLLLVPIVVAAWGLSIVGKERVGPALLAAIGIVAAGWAGPMHPWSGVLRDLPGGVSPEAVGAAVLYAAVGISVTRDGEGPMWLVVRLANLIGLAGLFLRMPPMAFAVPLGWAAGMAALPASVFPALVTLPAGLARLLTGGADFRPEGLATSYPVEPTANLWWAGAFLASGPTLVFGAAVALAVMTATPYAGYRLRRATPGPGRAALIGAAGLAATCVLSPELWPGVLVVLAGALPLFVADARQAG